MAEEDWDDPTYRPPPLPKFDPVTGTYERPRQQRRGNYSYRPTQSSNSKFVNISVPTRFVGRIIGKGGSKIADLQFESGAKINVTKETVGDQTTIKISGLDDEIEKARTLIQDLTVDRPPRLQIVPEPASTSAVEPAVENKPPMEDIDYKAISEACDKHMREKWLKAPAMKKDFYHEDPQVKNMTAQEVASFREQNNNIVVSRITKDGSECGPIPHPIQTFEQAFRPYPLILREIKKAGFTVPSPIQTQGWPILLSGDDLIGIAQTGTGKTLAFLLPALIHIDGQPEKERRKGPTVLIMAPTRELALQIERETNKYQYKNIRAVCVYGGGSRQDQIDSLSKGVQIVIATPGRLSDLILAGYIDLESVTYVVLDEADRMLDMGFEAQIRKVLFGVRPNRQTVMTSATWPIGVRRLVDSYMVNPVQVYVGTLDLAAVHTVTQTIIMLSDNEDEKFETVVKFTMGMQSNEKAIIFCGKKARADDLSAELTLRGVLCTTLHGNRDQSDREQALADITDGTINILIATDVASRGIDIEDITFVINYDFPRNIEEYVHRVGRTGRAGRTGCSITYFTRSDWSHAAELIPILVEANQHVPEELYKMSDRYADWKKRKDQERQRGGGGRGRRGGNSYYNGGGFY